MIVVLSILALLSLTASVLALSSTGHLHTKTDALQTDIAELFDEVQFSGRVTRKVLAEKVLPTIGYREPESMEDQLNQAMHAFSVQLAKRSGTSGD